MRAESDARDGRGRPVMTHTDALTGLGNRKRMKDKIDRLVTERAEDPAPFTLGIANLDGFRPINDLFGREAGDIILTQVAHRLHACIPEGATVVRLENDDFGFVLPLIFDERGARRTARILKDVLSAPFDLGERSVRLTASFGFSIYPFAGEDYETLNTSAETALYRAKRRGRGQIVVYSHEIAAELRRATELEQALRRAIIAEKIETYFQPIVNLNDGALVGFEALARWHDDDLGFVPPNVFITLAEERGFIDLVTELLLKQATRAALNWPDELFLSFNLSSAQLVDPTTSDTILSILRRTSFPPARLELEITETAMMSDPDMARTIIGELRGAGIRVSLDDFGTGQSSLGRLRDFTFDKVKVDRAFVSEITRHRPSEHIVKAILTMCEGLDLHVVAEGIEERGQAEKLIELGCPLGQGYHYGRPMRAAQALELVRSRPVARKFTARPAGRAAR